MEEEKEVLKCKTCELVIEDSKKYFKKSQECRKCYDKRWLREKRAKNPDKPSTTKSLPHGDTGNGKAKSAPQGLKLANESRAIEKLNNEIAKLSKELGLLDEQASVIRHELGIYEKVRGMLG